MKAAIIGLGPHGNRVARAIIDHPRLELAAVVDRSAAALEAADLPEGASKLGDAKHLWADPPEVVCVVTNGPSHVQFIEQALEAGVKRLLVEKPMGCSLDECDRMIDGAAQHNARLIVNNSRRYEPVYQWMRERIVSGQWGELRNIWIQRPGIGLGCLGVHSFDLVHFLAGTSTECVTAWVDPPVKSNPRGAQFVDPGGTVVMTLGRNVRAVIAQIEDGAGPMTFELHCTAARVTLDEKFENIHVLRRDLSVIPGPGRPPKFDVEAPPDVPLKPNMFRSLAAVLDDLVADGEIIASAQTGRDAVEVLVASHLSHERGNLPVSLPLVAESDRAHWLSVT